VILPVRLLLLLLLLLANTLLLLFPAALRLRPSTLLESNRVESQPACFLIHRSRRLRARALLFLSAPEHRSNSYSSSWPSGPWCCCCCCCYTNQHSIHYKGTDHLPLAALPTRHRRLQECAAITGHSYHNSSHHPVRTHSLFHLGPFTVSLSARAAPLRCRTRKHSVDVPQYLRDTSPTVDWKYADNVLCHSRSQSEHRHHTDSALPSHYCPPTSAS
jgi:hypothetical protein